MTSMAQAKTFHTNAIFSPISSAARFNPNGGLAADAQGRLYGVTAGGGTFGAGTVYRLAPGKLKSDPWTTETLHSVTDTDRASPYGGLYIDAAGAVYGAAQLGGLSEQGTVWRLDNAPGWPITVLHIFGKLPGARIPRGGVALGKDGRLYGSTEDGGKTNAGAVFDVSPLGDSVSYQVVHSFEAAVDGAGPTAFTIQGDGAIYGITGFSGASAVFRLAEETAPGATT